MLFDELKQPTVDLFFKYLVREEYSTKVLLCCY